MNDNDNDNNIKCLRCGTDMVEANFETYMSAQPIVKRTRKGILSAPVQSGVNCLVCRKCGYIELRATEPHKLKFRTE
jgi:rubrerythrin